MTTIPFEPQSIEAPEAWKPTLDDVQTGVRPFAEVPRPRGVRSVASFDLNALATSEDVMKLQSQANAFLDERRRGLDLGNLTFSGAMKDVYEATFGLARDVFRNTGGPVSIDTFTKNNRLRGLGILLIMIALLSFA